MISENTQLLHRVESMEEETKERRIDENRKMEAGKGGMMALGNSLMLQSWRSKCPLG